MAMPKVLDWLDDLVAQVATNVTNIAKNASDIAANKALFDTHTADDNRHWTTEDRQNFDRTIHFKGYFISLDKLKEAYPTGELGDYAIVGGTDTVWLWDDETNSWLNSTEQGIVISVNGRTGEVILTKTDVGLSNVDNTSDVDKPVSTAQQVALDKKTDKKRITASEADGFDLGSGIYELRDNSRTILGFTSSQWTVIVGENFDNNKSATQIWMNYNTDLVQHIYMRRQQNGHRSWSEFSEILTSTHLATLDNTMTEMQTNIQTNATNINDLGLNKADRQTASLAQLDSEMLRAGIYNCTQSRTILDYTDGNWTVIVGEYGQALARTQIWIPYQAENTTSPKMFLRRYGSAESGGWSDFVEILTTKHITSTELEKMKQYKGYYAQVADLRTALPTATDGDYAIVGSALYIWNSKTGSWTEVSGSGGSTGSGKWSVKVFGDKSQLLNDTPEIKDVINKKILSKEEVEDTENELYDSPLKIDTDILSNYILVETWVNFSEDTELNLQMRTNNLGCLFVNGEFIAKTTQSWTWLQDVPVKFISGWNKIQILTHCVDTSTTNAKVQIVYVDEIIRKITDNINCLKIDCYHSENDLVEGYVPLVGDSTIEGDVTVEGVVGVTSNAYLSYNSEEDSLSFSFAGKPEGGRGNYSNPMSIENWNKLTAQVEKNTNDLENNYAKKAYVDELIGDINTLLDNLNGEVI